MDAQLSLETILAAAVTALIGSGALWWYLLGRLGDRFATREALQSQASKFLTELHETDRTLEGLDRRVQKTDQQVVRLEERLENQVQHRQELLESVRRVEDRLDRITEDQSATRTAIEALRREIQGLRRGPNP